MSDVGVERTAQRD